MLDVRIRKYIMFEKETKVDQWSMRRKRKGKRKIVDKG